jgi:hypothetical protein
VWHPPIRNLLGLSLRHAITASGKGCILSVNETVSFETFWQRPWQTGVQSLETSLLARPALSRPCLGILATFMLIYLFARFRSTIEIRGFSRYDYIGVA